MAKTGYIGVGNVARKASGLYVGVNDVARKVTKAYVGDANGKARLWFDQSGITLDKIPIGQSIYLKENGAAVEYLVVNQGIPGNSDLYDASCDGTWLLRKDCHSQRQWNTSDVNTYANSAINTWLNGDFFNSLGSIEKATIKQAKIPYCIGNDDSTVNSGVNGLPCKFFLLAGYEIGIGGVNNLPQDGAKLDYFNQNSNKDSKRIAYLNGSANYWGLRSPYTYGSIDAWGLTTQGGCSRFNVDNLVGVRPACILPQTAKFDANTMVLKGVA